MRMLAAPHSVPLSSGAGDGTRRQTCPSVSGFFGVPPLASSAREPAGPVSFGVSFSSSFFLEPLKKIRGSYPAALG